MQQGVVLTCLELPLGRHDLCVDTRDVYTSVKTGTVVSLNEITSKDLAGTDTTVVRALWSWETALWPTVWLSIGVEEGVLLLDTEPRILLLGLVHGLLGVVAVVGLVRRAVAVVAFRDDLRA